MTIQEARFNKPWNIGRTEPTQEQVIQALQERDHLIITYPEGTFDVSPLPGTERKHELVVLENGNGSLRRIRRDGGTVPKATSPTGEKISLEGDTHTLQEGVLPLVIGSNMPKSKTEMGVYSVLLHIPGPSPAQMHREQVTHARPESSGPQVRRVQLKRQGSRRERRGR